MRPLMENAANYFNGCCQPNSIKDINTARHSEDHSKHTVSTDTLHTTRFGLPHKYVHLTMAMPSLA